MKSYPTSNTSNNDQVSRALGQLLGIMDELREKCPWDQKQTMESLRHLTIEEAFELSEAILEANMENIKKELGDLLLHIVFYTKIAAEQRAFTMVHVIQTLCKKLIDRHPHIYGEKVAENAQSVERHWEKQKLQEKGNKSVLGGVPHTLPSLIKTMRIQEKMSRIGFGWPDSNTTRKKIQKHIQVLTQQSNQEVPTTMRQEAFGELLFLLVNYARLVNVNPEEALEKKNKEFTQKFQHVEQEIASQDKQITQLSTKELMDYWKKAN